MFTPDWQFYGFVPVLEDISSSKEPIGVKLDEYWKMS